MNLADLPRFNVDTVQERDGEVRLSGRLSHLRGVRAGRSWLYAGIDASIIGDLEIVDHATANAVFITSDRVLCRTGHGESVLAVGRRVLAGVPNRHDR